LLFLQKKDARKEALSEAPIKQADVIDMLLTAVVVVDPDLHIVYMNPAAESLFGTSASRAIDRGVDALLYDDGSNVFGVLGEVFESGLTLTRRAAEFRTRQGQEVTADLTISLDPIMECAVVELQPISRLVRINRDDRARSSFKTTRELIRGLAHEVKNPLGGLRGAAQLLERELDSADLKEYTQIIIQEADRLSELVDRLLGPTREPRTGSFNIHRILEHVIRLVDVEYPGPLDFQRDYDPSLPELFGDEDQIIQAILNMVRNAAQSLAESDTAAPSITLRTRVVRTFTIAGVKHRMVARIDIIDNGPGIEASMIDEIFYPMITTRADGSGLGLAITQSVIGQHGGVIECESQPGRTCFSVFLPLEVEEMAEAAENNGTTSK
jgi:two-component system nitrogen regulation sensor histidine kinase GlnL